MTTNLRELCERAAKVFGSPQNHTSAQIDAMVSELEAAGRGEAWISVDERLPDADIEVVVFEEEIGISIDYVDVCAETGDEWFANDPDRVITHWMPTPPPPEEPTND